MRQPIHINKDASENGSALPPPVKNGWIIVFVAFGIIGIIVFVLTTLYRVQPKDTGLVEKRKIPAKRGVYAVVLSPLDSASALAVAHHLTSEIGKDSSVTKMVVGGTYLYKQSTSLWDYEQVVRSALQHARPANLETQSVLLTQIAGILANDALPSKVYLLGDIGGNNYEAVDSQLAGAASSLQIRHQTLGPVQIASYELPSSMHSPAKDSIRALFFNNFRKRGFDVVEEQVVY